MDEEYIIEIKTLLTGWSTSDWQTPMPVGNLFTIEDRGPNGYGCEGDGHYIRAYLPPGRYRLVKIEED